MTGNHNLSESMSKRSHCYGCVEEEATASSGEYSLSQLDFSGLGKKRIGFHLN